MMRVFNIVSLVSEDRELVLCMFVRIFWALSEIIEIWEEVNEDLVMFRPSILVLRFFCRV